MPWDDSWCEFTPQFDPLTGVGWDLSDLSSLTESYNCRSTGCPRQDSNLRTRLRRAVLYPLSYGGSRQRRDYQPDAGRWARNNASNSSRNPAASTSAR
jgi:hypothetical protein